MLHVVRHPNPATPRGILRYLVVVRTSGRRIRGGRPPSAGDWVAAHGATATRKSFNKIKTVSDGTGDLGATLLLVMLQNVNDM